MTKSSHPRKMSKEEVFSLIEQYQKHGCEESQLKLIKQYQSLVESIAKRYTKGSPAIHEDLVQVGMIGLLGAIRRFDVSYGGKFETFAYPTIIGEMKRFLRDKTWSVHVPRRIKELYPKIKQAVEDMRGPLERSPNIKEIAESLNVSEEYILETIEMAQSYRALSIDHCIEADSDGGSFTILDLIGNSDPNLKNVEDRLLLNKISSVLTERERDILQHTFIKNRSQKDTGEILGISQMHVSRLQRRALDKLKEVLEKESDDPYIHAYTLNNYQEELMSV